MDCFRCSIAYYSKMRKAGTAMAVSLALEVLCCNVILKPLMARIGPCDVNAAVHLLIRRPADFSFPSGHTGAALRPRPHVLEKISSGFRHVYLRY